MEGRREGLYADGACCSITNARRRREVRSVAGRSLGGSGWDEGVFIGTVAWEVCVLDAALLVKLEVVVLVVAGEGEMIVSSCVCR